MRARRMRAPAHAGPSGASGLACEGAAEPGAPACLWPAGPGQPGRPSQLVVASRSRASLLSRAGHEPRAGHGPVRSCRPGQPVTCSVQDPCHDWGGRLCLHRVVCGQVFAAGRLVFTTGRRGRAFGRRVVRVFGPWSNSGPGGGGGAASRARRRGVSARRRGAVRGVIMMGMFCGDGDISWRWRHFVTMGIFHCD